MKDNQKPVVWIHCSSLGEFEQGRPVMETIRKARPDLFIVLSFFSPSGYEIRKNYNQADLVTYLPLDTKKNASRWMELIRPSVAIFVKYDFWYNFLQEANRNHARIFLISAIFRPNQLFFRWYGSWYRRILRFYDHIFVQQEQSAGLLRKFGIDHVSVNGDTRFDRVISVASAARDIEIAARFATGNPVIVAGSTWEPDEDMLLRYISETTLPVKMIMAPHELSDAHIRRIRKRCTVPCMLYSMAGQKPEELAGARVLVIDNIGMLSSLYRYGAVAYIGGGFGKGIHNVLEAAVYGMPVIFGPQYGKFREALDLIGQGGALPVRSYDELHEILNRLFSIQEERNRRAGIAGDYVRNHTGATSLIMQTIQVCFEKIPLS